MMSLAPVALLLAAAASSADVFPRSSTDPRFELLGVIQLLAGSDRAGAGVFRHDIPYVRRAEARFARFARHPVVERYAELTRGGLDYLAAYHFVYALGAPPELFPREELPEELAARFGGRLEAEEFRLLSADFARTSRFADFYRETADERAAMAAEIDAQAAALNARGKLAAYTGLPVEGDFALILSPFAEPSLAAAFFRSGAGAASWRLECVYGPEDFEGRVQYRLATRLGSIWSELLLAQLLTAAEGFRERLSRSRALYGAAGRACAADWPACVSRHVAFAAAARILDRDGYHDAAAEWPVKYGRIGIPYLQPLIDSLKEYEAQRGRYPTLLDFYPRLLDALERQSPRAVPFLGGVERVLAAGVDAVVLPSAAPAGLRARAASLFPKAELLSDEAALQADLKGKNLAVLGLPRDNRWLAQEWRRLRLPVKFIEGGLSLTPRGGDERRDSFKGRLGLVSAALSPADAAQGLVLYAAELRDLSDLLGAYGGPADFAIMDGTAAVKTGLYEKSRLPWRVK